MNDTELLDLIKKGETEAILQQKDLTARLNILAAQGLVEIHEGKLIITSKVDNSKKDCPTLLVNNTKLQKEMEEFSSSTLKRNSLYVYLSLLLLCAAAVTLSIIVFQG